MHFVETTDITVLHQGDAVNGGGIYYSNDGGFQQTGGCVGVVFKQFWMTAAIPHQIKTTVERKVVALP